MHRPTLLFAVSLNAFAASLSGDVLYVDQSADGTGDGSSWESAFTHLAEAIDAAADGDEIWVARGVYQPTEDGDRSVSFLLKPGVALYGGFRGGESERSFRNPDPTRNGCALSGDLAGNDAAGSGFEENSYHVLDARGAASSARVDGFAVEGGNADLGSGFDERGGGAVMSVGDSVQFHNVWFRNNRSLNFGGALYANDSSVELASCVFSDNRSPVGGAAYYNLGSVAIYNSRFYNNHASINAGAIRNARATLICVNTIFAGNTSATTAAAIEEWSSTGSTTLINCTVVSNTAADGEYALSAAQDGTLRLHNSIVLFNSPASGSQIQSGSLSQQSTNLVAGEDPFVNRLGLDQIAGTLDDDYRLAFPSITINRGDNANVPADALDLDGDGDLSEPTPFDANGAPRIQRGRVDVGAVESSQAFTWFVDPSQPGPPDGRAWETALPRLHQALALAEDYDAIWVAPGTYRPGNARTDSFTIDKALTVLGGFSPGATNEAQRNTDPLANGCVLSGDVGISGDPTDNLYHVVTVPGQNPCVLSGFAVRHGNANGASELQQNGGGIVTYFGSQIELSHLLIEDNYATRFGGGISAAGSIALSDSTVRDNRADSRGGGVYFISFDVDIESYIRNSSFERNRGGGLVVRGDEGTLSIDRLVFYQNQAPLFGSGLSVSLDGASLIRSWFVENGGGRGGAAIFSQAQDLTIDRCVFFGNGRKNSEDAIHSTDNASLALSNSLFAGNASSSLALSNSSARVENCSFVGNASSLYTITAAKSQFTLYNSLVVGESLDSNLHFDETISDLQSNVIQGEAGYVDPLVKRLPDAGDGDWSTYHDNDYGDLNLQPASPLIDAGDNRLVSADADLHGNARLQDDPEIADTGSGDAPIVDIGAREGSLESSWLALYGGLPLRGDLNRDGIQNIDAYWLGNSPFTRRAIDSLARIESNDGHLQVVFNRRTGLPFLATRVSYSTDLREWDRHDASEAPFLDEIATETLNEIQERVTATIAPTYSVPDAQIFFVRVDVREEL